MHIVYVLYSSRIKLHHIPIHIYECRVYIYISIKTLSKPYHIIVLLYYVLYNITYTYYKLTRILTHILYCLHMLYANTYYTGDVTHNLWIVKPAAKSRGRGIMTFADLKKLLKYVESGSGCSYANQWIVQVS